MLNDLPLSLLTVALAGLTIALVMVQAFKELRACERYERAAHWA